MEIMNKIFEKLSPGLMKFANAKATRALKDGLILTMPLTLVGSIFLLIGCAPFTWWDGWMTGIFGAGWADPIWQVVGSTFDIIALAAVFGITYTYVKNEGHEGAVAGVLGIVSFLIVTASYTLADNGVKIGGVIPKAWTGGKGMVAAIIIGLAVGYIYSWFMNNDIRIKLPEGVPTGVANAFNALIPATAIITLSMLLFIVLWKTTGSTFIEWIYKVLQTPLQGMTDSLAGAVLIPLLISLFWWFGIHGSAVVMGVMGPLVTANALANQDIVTAGEKLVVGQNAHVVTNQFIDQFITFGGAGMTLGLVIAMIVFGKSAHVKKLGKLALTPGLFNINEPVIFGLPIVLNPIMLVPFILVPVLSGAITYGAIYFGFLKVFTATTVPWTTPPIISGLIVGGWRAALLQALLTVMAALIYYPFLKKQDKDYLSNEYTESNQGIS